MPKTPNPHQALCAETVYTLNDALCGFYHANCPALADALCPPHTDDREVCEDSRPECEEEVKVDPACSNSRTRQSCAKSCTGCCGDSHPTCRSWALTGECEKSARSAEARTRSRLRSLCSLCSLCSVCSVCGVCSLCR